MCVCVCSPTLQLTVLQISIFTADVVLNRSWICSCVSGTGGGTGWSSASSWTHGEQQSALQLCPALRWFHEEQLVLLHLKQLLVCVVEPAAQVQDGLHLTEL